MIDPAFWRGRRVFLTGHMGFKGGWLALWLRRLGAEVTGFSDAPPSTPALFTVANVASSVRSIVGDVCDLAALRAALVSAMPSIVFHFAAQSLVRESYREPIRTFATNVMGTANLLEAVRSAASVEAVVVVTSDKCYENREWLWPYRESDPLGGFDPYSASKAAAEIVAASWRRSFFSREGSPSPHRATICTARAGNVIGGGDWGTDQLMADIVRGFAMGQAVRIRSPEAVRPWQHVLDALQGYVRLAELCTKAAEYGDAWNFGPSDEGVRTVRWIVERACAAWGGNASWIADAPATLHEAAILKLDSSRARHRLAWTPRLALEVTLDWTIEWYRAHLQGQDMHAFTIDQIQRYERMLS